MIPSPPDSGSCVRRPNSPRKLITLASLAFFGGYPVSMLSAFAVHEAPKVQRI